MRGHTGEGPHDGHARCKASSHGRGVSDGDGTVHLTLRRSYLPLLKGTYSDQLTLRVTPRC
jgi:hypothetical protein